MRITLTSANQCAAIRLTGRHDFSRAGLTLVEVIISIALAAITVSAIISGYVLGAQRMEWASQNASAQMSAVNTLERVRAAKWDTRTFPPIDQLVASNFPPSASPLNLPTKGTNNLRATNFVEITTLSSDPPLKLIRVECIWRSSNGDLFTNLATTYRAPDQ